MPGLLAKGHAARLVIRKHAVHMQAVLYTQVSMGRKGRAMDSALAVSMEPADGCGSILTARALPTAPYRWTAPSGPGAVRTPTRTSVRPAPTSCPTSMTHAHAPVCGLLVRGHAAGLAVAAVDHNVRGQVGPRPRHAGQGVGPRLAAWQQQVPARIRRAKGRTRCGRRVGQQVGRHVQLQEQQQHKPADGRAGGVARGASRLC